MRDMKPPTGYPNVFPLGFLARLCQGRWIGVTFLYVVSLCVASSPARAVPYLYVASGFDLVVVDAGTNTVIATIPDIFYFYLCEVAIATSPDGSRLYAVEPNCGNQLDVIDTATYAVVASVPIDTDSYGLDRVAVHPSGQFVYATDAVNGRFHVISTATNSVVDTIELAGWPFAIAVHPAGSFIYVTDLDGGISVINSANDAVIDHVPLSACSYHDADIPPSGNPLYVAGGSGCPVSVVDTLTRTETAQINETTSSDLAVLPSGKVVYLAHNGSQNVFVIDTGTYGVITTIPIGSQTGVPVVKPSGSRLYVAKTGASGGISVIDTFTNHVIGSIDVPYLRAMVFGCPGADADHDAIGAGCDNAAVAYNPDQSDGDLDGKGDALDPDFDNDGCWNEDDEDPGSSLEVVGQWTNQCGHSTGPEYGFTGVDSDGDGLLDCEDSDNDNDGITDVLDPCPVTYGDFGCSGGLVLPCGMIDLQLTCAPGPGCGGLFLKLVDPSDPNPTHEVLYDHFEPVNEAVYVYPIEGLSLQDTAFTFASSGVAPRLLRLEAWAAATVEAPEHFVALVAEFDPALTAIGDMDLGAVLRLIPPADSRFPLVVEAAWTVGQLPGILVADGDADQIPDPFDNCVTSANSDQSDSDGDRAGDVCDCAPTDPSAFAIPEEVMGQVFASDHATMSWTSGIATAGSGLTYAVLRGQIGELPVGDGRSEECIASSLEEPTYLDPDVPLEGTGSWYLVNAMNSCGVGTNGTATDGTPRVSRAVCP